jgi:hypothetical protein
VVHTAFSNFFPAPTRAGPDFFNIQLRSSRHQWR